MSIVLFSKELKFNQDIDSLHRRLSDRLKEKSREHTSTHTGILGKVSGNKIRIFYRYKKLEDNDISLIPGKLPDLTVHHKYAKVSLTPISDSSTRLTINFVDDSKLFIQLALFVFFPLFVLLSAFLSFSAVGDGISNTAAGIISLFFAALWLFIAFSYVRSVKEESDETFPLLEKEIDNLLNNL